MFCIQLKKGLTIWFYSLTNLRDGLGYVTLSSNGNFTQTDVVYSARVWLPKLGKITQADSLVTKRFRGEEASLLIQPTLLLLSPQPSTDL